MNFKNIKEFLEYIVSQRVTPGRVKAVSMGNNRF